MSLTPPAGALYASYENAKEALRNHARKEGYVITKKRSKRDKRTGEVRKVWLQCDKSGKPITSGTKRNTFSRKTDCPFELTLTRTRLQKWQVTTLHGTHNHDASSVAAQHPCHRKRTDRDIDAPTIDTVSIEERSSVTGRSLPLSPGMLELEKDPFETPMYQPEDSCGDLTFTMTEGCQIHKPKREEFWQCCQCMDSWNLAAIHVSCCMCEHKRCDNCDRCSK